MRRIQPSLMPLAVATLLTVAPASAATVVTLTIEGIDQPIECLAYEQSVRQPKSGSSGQASGAPVYDDIVCRKRIDASSPALLKAVSTGQHLKKAVFKFTTEGSADSYTVTISDVRVTGVKQFSPGTSERPAAAGSAPRPMAPGPITSKQPAMEDVSFGFAKIEWSQGARNTSTVVR